MRTTTGLVLALLAVVAAASVIPTEHKKIADKDLLLKQKNILQLLVRVHQPNMYLDQKTIGDKYDVEGNLDKYTDIKVVKQFVSQYKKGMLPRGEVFSVLYTPHMEEAIKLFDLFYFAKDWDTFYKTVCWARDRVNEGQFVYSLNVAVLHRKDTKDIVLPPIYEVTPHLFVDAETIQKAYEVRMQEIGVNSNEVKTVVIPTQSNLSAVWNTINPEYMLNYFTEDVGLNTYHTYFHLMYPFWMTTKNYGLQLERYGELFVYIQQQILARYNLERLTLGLPEVNTLLLNEPIEIGYASMLRYQNGKEVPMRPDGVTIQDEDIIKVQDIKDIELRLREAIDLGYVIAKDGSKVSIYEQKGIDILGDLVKATGQSVNYRYYGSLYKLLSTLISRVVDPINKHGVSFGVLENFETALRDPVYYRMCKRIDIIFRKYKQMLGYYTQDELAFPGLKIENVEIDKLITYIDNFDIDLMNAISVSQLGDAEKLNIVARQPRLNHKPFTYKITVSSDKEATVMVRVFLGPKSDVMKLDTLRKYMVELDRFPYQVSAGKTVIKRDSKDSNLIIKDSVTYSTKTLLKKVKAALKGEHQLYVDEIAQHCGFPERLLLPQGLKSGMPFSLFVMVTPYEGQITELPKAFIACGAGFNNQYPDIKPMGYPFDRIIKDYEFTTPNMYFKDVLIFHKKAGDLSIEY